jgi:hypothetical protein
MKSEAETPLISCSKIRDAMSQVLPIRLRPRMQFPNSMSAPHNLGKGSIFPIANSGLYFGFSEAIAGDLPVRRR